MIEPVFEEIAQAMNSNPKGRGAGGKVGVGGQVAFVKVDLGVGMGSMVAREYGVTATPTFGFFLDGKKVRVAFPFFSMWLRSHFVRRFTN